MLAYFAKTDLGNKRDNNEDYYLACPKINMWILADGGVALVRDCDHWGYPAQVIECVDK